MTIGEAIKNIRLSLNVTRKDFSGDVIDSSYLARVEKDQNEIRSTILLDLLRRNKVKMFSFLEKIGGVI